MALTDTLEELKFSFETIVPDTFAVILAAGSSTRMGENKQFISIGGVPVIMRSVLAFEKADEIMGIVIVAKSDDIPILQRLCDEYNITKLVDIVQGGDTRAISAKNGVARCGSAEYIAIHDGARPLVTHALIKTTVEAARIHGAAIPGTPLKDTIKIIDTTRRVEATPERSGLVAVQTPQVFKTAVYKDALLKLGEKAEDLTDDAAILENAGYPVFVVSGEESNIKITTPSDVVLANSFLEE